jgi:hypothetical protein
MHSSFCNFLQSPISSSLLVQIDFLNILFPNKLNERFSLNVTDRVYDTHNKKLLFQEIYFSFCSNSAIRLENFTSFANNFNYLN